MFVNARMQAFDAEPPQFLEQPPQEQKLMSNANEVPHTLTSYGSPAGRSINEQLTETKDILKQLEHYLRGIRKIRDLTTGEIRYEQRNPVLPERMVDELMMHLHTRYNPQTTYGIFRTGQVNEMAKEFGLLITDWMCNSYYELKWSNNEVQIDKKSLKLVISNIHYMFYNLLSRAVEGKTQDGIINMNKVYGESKPVQDFEGESGSASGPTGKAAYWLKKIAGG